MPEEQTSLIKFRRDLAVLRTLQVFNCIAAAAVLFLCFVGLPARGIHLTNKSTGIFILVLCLVGLPCYLLLIEMRVRAVKRKLSESTSSDNAQSAVTKSTTD